MSTVVRRLTSLDEAASLLSVSRNDIQGVLPWCAPDFASRPNKKITPKELLLVIEAVRTIQIDVGTQVDGYVFKLHPRSKLRIKFPSTVTVPSRLFVSFETMSDFTAVYGKSMLVRQVPVLLTGLSNEQLSSQGFTTVSFFDVIAQTPLKKVPLEKR